MQHSTIAITKSSKFPELPCEPNTVFLVLDDLTKKTHFVTSDRTGTKLYPLARHEETLARLYPKDSDVPLMKL